MLRRLALSLVLLSFGALAESPADAHLLEGAEHFRAGRFDEALVEFEVAQRLGAPGEAAWYVGASLVKLHRAEEAIEAFARAAQVAPEGADPLLGYYHAMAYYDARLYLSADRLLAKVAENGGARLAEQARKVRADIASFYAREPAVAVIDFCHTRGQAASKQGRAALAAAYFDEAASLAQRRADHHRLAEAKDHLAGAGGAPP